MTTTERFDLVVIGGGAAAEKGAAQAAYLGKRVAVIGRRERPGGATVHTGALPSKTLREAALFLSGYRQRDLYGVSVEVAKDLEVAALIQRKNAVRELETDRMRENLARHEVELVQGWARLADATTVEVTDDADESLACSPRTRSCATRSGSPTSWRSRPSCRSACTRSRR
jgi:NAD(P) transhydrogenase